MPLIGAIQRFCKMILQYNVRKNTKWATRRLNIQLPNGLSWDAAIVYQWICSAVDNWLEVMIKKYYVISFTRWCEIRKHTSIVTWQIFIKPLLRSCTNLLGLFKKIYQCTKLIFCVILKGNSLRSSKIHYPYQKWGQLNSRIGINGQFQFLLTVKSVRHQKSRGKKAELTKWNWNW